MSRSEIADNGSARPGPARSQKAGSGMLTASKVERQSDFVRLTSYRNQYKNTCNKCLKVRERTIR